VSALRGRFDLPETGVSQYTQASSLALSTLTGPPGLSSILVSAISPGTGSSPAALFVPIGGNLPAQTGWPFETDGIASERPVPAIEAEQWAVAIADLEPGYASRALAGRTVTEVVRHSTPHPGTELTASAQSDRSDEVPSLRGADLIAEALPFDRISLENALDQFLRRLDALDVGEFATHGPAAITLFTLAWLGSALSVETTRRFLQRRMLIAQGIRQGDPRWREVPIRFPELPGSWSETVR
jgi:hypothetical protein